MKLAQRDSLLRDYLITELELYSEISDVNTSIDSFD